MNTLPPLDPIDPRGPRFNAAVSTLVLTLTLIAGPRLGLPLLIVQISAGTAASLLGHRYQPYGWLYRRFLRPRLAAPRELVEQASLRFAHALNLFWLVAAALGALLNSPVLFSVPVGIVLADSVLSATLDFSLGRWLFELLRGRSRRTAWEASR